MTATTTRKYLPPRAWLDKNNVPCFRSDVPLEEASELQDMLGAAFNAGVSSGYAQAGRRTDGPWYAIWLKGACLGAGVALLILGLAGAIN